MNIVIWMQSETGGGEYILPAIHNLIRLYGTVNIIGGIPLAGSRINGIRNISKQDLQSLDFDLIVASVKDVSVLFTNAQSAFVSILKEAAALGIDTNKIVLDRVICIPNFTLEKYRRLRNSALSVFSKDCFGGWTYHRFGLPFLSPTINMFTSEKDFIKFLQNPMENVKAEVVFQKMHDDGYPVFKIGGIEWHMNHYRDVNVAFKKWYERSFRINWFNLFVVMSTENPEILAEFDKLPFAKKVCFVPFETDLDSGFYIDASRYSEKNFARLTHLMVLGEFIYYDLWDMLLYGKKTLLI